MEAIFPISALQKKQSVVKQAARDGIVRITENGVGAYVLCAEDVFKRALEEAAEDAAYEARMAAVIERGRADVAAGRVVRGREAFEDEVARRMAQRG